MIAAGVVGIFIWKPGEIASRLAKDFFALAFGWIGLVVFLALGQELLKERVKGCGGKFVSLDLAATGAQGEHVNARASPFSRARLEGGQRFWRMICAKIPCPM